MAYISIGKMIDCTLRHSCISTFRCSPRRIIPPKNVTNSHYFNVLRKKSSFFFSLSCSTSDSQIEIISTKEDPDGSFVFRFGLPSEKDQHFSEIKSKNCNSVVKKSGGSLMDFAEDASESHVHVSPKRVKISEGDDDQGFFSVKEFDAEDNVSSPLENQILSSQVCSTSESKDFAGVKAENRVNGVSGIADDSVENLTSTLGDSGIDKGVCTSSEQTTENIPNGTFQLKNDNSDSKASKGLNKELSESLVDSLEVKQQDAEAFESHEKTNLRLASGVHMLPHPSKASTGGEDAYFISDNNWIGVADGVGQWALEGINSGLYAQELMGNCKKFVSGEFSDADPAKVLAMSAMKTVSLGSSTAVVARLTGQILDVVNLGDSGFLVVRGGSVIARSTPMTHGFNFPYQIERGDDPSSVVETYSINVDKEDVIVMATDGLFDNVYENEIASIIEECVQSGLGSQETAAILAQKAQERGKLTSGSSPFSDAARAAGYSAFGGGKLDDITVIISYVAAIEKA